MESINLLPELVEIITIKLDKRSLKSARLINHNWYNEIIRTLSTRLIPGQNNNSYDDDDDDHNNNLLIHCASSSIISSFRQFNIGNITNVKIDSNCWEHQAEFIMKRLDKECLQLKALTIQANLYDTKGSDLTLFQALVRYPNITSRIETFKWQLNGKDKQDNFYRKREIEDILAVIANLEFSSKLVNFHLSSLKDQDGTNFNKMLQNISDSVQILCLNGQYEQETVNIWNTEMKKLDTLIIDSSELYGRLKSNFLSKCPVLSTLIITSSGSVDQFFACNNNNNNKEEEEWNGIKTIDISHRTILQAKTFQNLSCLFPNLMILKIRNCFCITQLIKGLYTLSNLNTLLILDEKNSSARQIMKMMKELPNFKELRNFQLQLDDYFYPRNIHPVQLMKALKTSTDGHYYKLTLVRYNVLSGKGAHQRLQKFLKNNNINLKY